MNVKQLIKELEALPQNLEVEVAMHHDSEYESAGMVSDVHHFIKEEYYADSMSPEAQLVFDDMPDECVVIRCEEVS